MASETCESVLTCNESQLSLEQLFKRFLLAIDENGCLSIKTSNSESSSEVEFISTIESADGAIPAGAKSVSFNTSDDFVGTINGIARTNSTSIVFNAGNFDKTPIIPYTITAGTITIDQTI